MYTFVAGAGDLVNAGFLCWEFFVFGWSEAGYFVGWFGSFSSVVIEHKRYKPVISLIKFFFFVIILGVSLTPIG
jgi:hypothetical protein